MSEEKTTGSGQKRLSDQELEAIKKQLLDSIYADIGKSVVKKVLWIGGAVILALYAWMRAHGFDGGPNA
jgi:hypothetical protein